MDIQANMTRTGRTRILFSGYAYVHFACFRPLYDRLSQLPGVDVYVSGGLRSRTDDGFTYDERSMYEPFGLPADRILTVEQIRDLDFDYLFAANTKLIEPRSVGVRVQIFHGISFRNRAIRPENMSCDCYFLVGPYMQRQFAESGLLPKGDSRGLPVGFMKTDRLLNGELDRSALLRDHGFDGTRPVLLYAPTGLKHNSLETMGGAVISRLIESDRYDLIIKPHDHPKNRIDWFERLSHFENDHCRVSRALDVTPLLYLSNLLMSDASSVSNEYALLNRPMVFLDVPKLLGRSRRAEGSMLDLNRWGRRGGVIVTSPLQVLDAVESSLADPDALSGIRRPKAADLFFNPGRATEFAANWVCNRMLGAATAATAS